MLAMTAAFPDAPIYTSVYDPDTTYDEFRTRDIRTSWLSKVATFREDPRRALPLLAAAWSNTVIDDDVDVVVCSSTGWSHGVTTSAPKVVYCHNPARWLYQGDEYLADAGRGARAVLKALAPQLRRWDRRAALSARTYLANSSVVAERIADTYGIRARVVHPPAAITAGPVEPIPGIAPGYLLTVGRSRGYKNTHAVAEAVQQLPDERLVAVGGLPAGSWSDRISGLTNISDAQLRWLYRNADALVACAYEDFGLTPIEAYSAGTPAIVLRAGGYLDTTVPGTTGEFVSSPEPDDIASGIRRFRQREYSAQEIESHASAFSVDSFAAALRDVVVDSRLAGPLVA